MRKKISVLLIVALVLLLLLLGLAGDYFVIEGAGGTLVWNADEAYLFLDTGHRGYHVPYLAYPIEMLKEYFGVAPLPRSAKFFVVVLKITPDSVQQYVTNSFGEPSPYDLYTPIDGTIYANKGGALWKWAGTHFEPASREEEKSLDGINHLTALDVSSAKGWTKRGGLLTTGEKEVKVPFTLRGQALTLFVRCVPIVGGAGCHGDNDVTIDLLGPGSLSRTLWHMEQRPRRVSKAEYLQFFRNVP